MPCHPCLLARSFLELCEMMEQHVSFSDDIVLGSVALLEGFFRNQAELTISRDGLPTSSDVPTNEVAMEEAAPIGGPVKEPTMSWVLHEEWAKIEAPSNQFSSWEKVLHPSQLVTTAGWASPTFGESKWRYCHQSSEARRTQCQRVGEHLQIGQAEQNSPSPESPEPIQVVAPPLGFKGVMACLQGAPLLVTTSEVPLEHMQPETMGKPTVAKKCASHVVQDEASGITYMEMVTTSVGKVALRWTCPAAPNP